MRQGGYITFPEALRALRQANSENTNTDIVLIMDGVFRLSETLILDERDGERTGRTTFTNNRISDGGLHYLGSAAVWTGNSGQNTVSHNEISGGFQWAISAGWRWSFFPLLRAATTT